MTCSLHLMVNYTGMYSSVFYPPYGWSPFLTSWGRICCISYYYLDWSLLIYYGYDVPCSLFGPPPSWPCRLAQQWMGVHNWITPPLPWELFNSLLLLLISIILFNYKGVELFWPISLGKWLYGVLESLGVSLECRPVLVIEQHGFQYLHEANFLSPVKFFQQLFHYWCTLLRELLP